MEQDRVEHWNKGYNKNGLTYINPINRIPDYVEFIRGKKILEIGPGDGRQLNLIKPYASEYAIADISPRCLHNYVDTIEKRYLIHSFDDDFNDKFDLIVLFYVWHHVLMEETTAYMQFLSRHTVDGGHMCFNISTIGQKEPTYTTTTPRNPQEFKNFLTLRNYEVILESSEEPNNYLFLVRNCI